MDKIYKFFIFLRNNITPIKAFSIMLVMFGIIDNLHNPTIHIKENTFLELSLRGAVFFFGIFGLLGNGKSSQIRAFIVGLPFLYLATFYSIRYIETSTQSLLIPIVLTGVIGLWVVFVGAKYEYKRTSISLDRSIVDWLDSELNIKMGRKTKT